MDSSDHIRFACPSCGKQLVVDAQYAGKQGRCPGCHSVFTVPARNENQPDTVSSPEETGQRTTVTEPEARDFSRDKVQYPHRFLISLKGRRERVMLAAIIAEGGVILCLVIALVILPAMRHPSGVPRITLSDLVNNPAKYQGKEVEMDVVIMCYSSYLSELRVNSPANPEVIMDFDIRSEVPGGKIGDCADRHIMARIRVRIYDTAERNKNRKFYLGEVEDIILL
jgi:hypothetical protein